MLQQLPMSCTFVIMAMSGNLLRLWHRQAWPLHKRVCSVGQGKMLAPVGDSIGDLCIDMKEYE